MKTWVVLIVVSLTLLLVDSIWLHAQSHRYGALVQAVQQAPLRLNYTGAVWAYIFVLVLFWHTIFATNQSVWQTALVGWCAYGIFNGTNYALFQNYSVSTALLDTLWGGVLFGIMAAGVQALSD